MEIFGLMSLGLFLGMTHAMDADHIATVSAMWNRQGGKHGLMRRGLYWGAGHAIVAYRCARHYFWQSVFGDNSLSLPVDWWHNCSSMPCKAGRLLNIFLSLNHHHPEHLDNVTIRKHPREARIQTAMADTIHVAKPSRS